MITLEFSVIGSFLANLHDTAQLRKFVARYGLTAEDFTDNAARQAFAVIMAEDASDDAQTLARDVCAAVGVETTEKMMQGAAITAIDAEANIRKLADTALRTKAEDIFRSEWTKYGSKTSTGFILDCICEKLRSLQSYAEPDADIEAKPLAEFRFEGPEEQRPNALFPNGWFRKGQVMFLTSVAGSGKSVLVNQLCFAWSLGREMFGMKPFRPLSIGIIRPEDDDDEMAEFRDSIGRGFRKNFGWSESDVAEAEKRVEILPITAKRGKDFVNLLRRIQNKYHFDLVVINPLQGVSGIDLAKNNELSDFCRGGIDPIIKDDATKCGLLIVHHTVKPPSNADKVNFGKAPRPRLSPRVN